MSDTSTFSSADMVQSFDPDKRLRYSLGQVLGADDLAQEQFYLVGRDRQHNRSLHGYGTVAGLAVALRAASSSEVQVGPGLALTPTGCVVAVDALQCADFAVWVAAQAALGAPASDGTRSAYVVLRYRECAADALPLPGAPCCGDGDNQVFTRTVERFAISFEATAPPALEHAATARFGRLLRAVGVAPASGTPLAVADVPALLAQLRSGEASGGPWATSAAEHDAVLAALMRGWAVDIRPQLLAGSYGVARGPDTDEGVLLATLNFKLTSGAGGLDASTLQVDVSGRPVLLSTRALQELYGGSTVITAAPPPAPAPAPAPEPPPPPAPASAPAVWSGDVNGPPEANSVVALQGVPLNVAIGTLFPGAFLAFDGSRWAAQAIVMPSGPPVPVDVPVPAAEPAPPPVPDQAASRVVAAGMLGLAGPQGPVLGALVLVNKDPFVFSFDGYKLPQDGDGRSYSVKALALAQPGQPVPVVGFAGFNERGIMLAFGLGSEAMVPDERTVVMLEVSAFEVPK
jgi:hypothetical protein